MNTCTYIYVHTRLFKGMGSVQVMEHKRRGSPGHGLCWVCYQDQKSPIFSQKSPTFYQTNVLSFVFEHTNSISAFYQKNTVYICMSVYVCVSTPVSVSGSVSVSVSVSVSSTVYICMNVYVCVCSCL